MLDDHSTIQLYPSLQYYDTLAIVEAEKGMNSLRSFSLTRCLYHMTYHSTVDDLNENSKRALGFFLRESSD
jgi:hypothetical protein